MNLRGKFQSPYSALLSTVFALPQQLPTDRIHAFYGNKVIVLEDKADVAAAEDGKLLVVHF